MFLSFKRQVTYTSCLSSSAVLFTPRHRILTFQRPFPDTLGGPGLQTTVLRIKSEFQMNSEYFSRVSISHILRGIYLDYAIVCSVC